MDDRVEAAAAAARIAVVSAMRSMPERQAAPVSRKVAEVRSAPQAMPIHQS